MENRKLTKRQARILGFIKEFRDRQGFPPTVREIGERFGISSSGVFDHLKALQVKGRLRREPAKPRAMKIVDEQKI